MAVTLTDAQRKLLDDKNLAHIATVDQSGNPQVTPTWIEYDGTHVLINTEQTRAKVKHLKANPQIAICVSNAQNPYQYVEIRGKVVEITAEGGDEGINRLSHKYIGKDYPYNKPGDVRVIMKVEPQKVFGMG